MYGCLSANSPCDYAKEHREPCGVCKDSAIRTQMAIRNRAIEEAERLLKSCGYTVTPPAS